jgi:biopolymer transport protein ExbD
MRTVANDDELVKLLQGAHEDWARMGQPQAPLIVDGDERVPWDQVMNVINLSRRVGIAKFQFAQGAGDRTPALR